MRDDRLLVMLKALLPENQRMNIELTPEQVAFVERAIASGQYASVAEVLAQVWAIGMKEVEQQIAREELQRLRKLREQAMAQMSCEETEVVKEQATEFLEEMTEVRRRSKYLRSCFGELLE